MNLGQGEVHVWRVANKDFSEQIVELEKLLSEEETKRANRFYFERDKSGFVIAHACLRLILSRYLELSPQAIQFSKAEHGKPYLRDNPQLKFNLTHSKQMILVAVSSFEVGVDVEAIERELEHTELASRFFAPAEAERIADFSGDEQRRAFFKTWTQKEAFIKGIGLGLSFPLNQFTVEVDPGEPGALLNVDDDQLAKENWCLFSFDVDALYYGALAVDAKQVLVKYLQLEKRNDI